MKIKNFKPVSKLHFSYIKFKFNDNVSFNDVFFSFDPSDCFGQFNPRERYLINSGRLILENDI